MMANAPTPQVDAIKRELCQRSKEASDLPNDWNDVVTAEFARTLERDNARLRADFRSSEALNKSQVWYWQGDGEDHLESLVVPVVIAPMILAAIVAEVASLRAALAESKSDLFFANAPSPADAPPRMKPITDSERMLWLHSNNEDAEGWEYGVVKIKFDDNGRRTDGPYWTASDHSDIDQLIEAARSALLPKATDAQS